MKIYKIEIVKTIKLFDIIEVKASCPQEAKEIVREMARNDTPQIKWDQLQKPSYSTEIIS